MISAKVTIETKYYGDMDAMRTRVRGITPSGSQHRHSFDVPSHHHQRPLPTHRLKTAQQKLPEVHYRLDDAEHRLDRLLAKRVARSPFARFETVLHALHGAGRLGQWRRLGESVLPMRVMSIAPRGKQWLDLRLHATLDVRRTEVARVGHAHITPASSGSD